MKRNYGSLPVARVCDVGRSLGTVGLLVDAVTRVDVAVALPDAVFVGGFVDG